MTTDLAPNPDALEVQIARFADLVGSLKPSAAQRRDGHISTLHCGDDLGGMSIGGLAMLHNTPDHPLRELIDTACSKACGATFKAERWYANVTACDACAEKAKQDAAMERAKKHWEKICPKGFLNTDRKHDGFPRAQHAKLKDWTGTQSLFFYGPTGQGKTRLALLMLKRAMLRNHWVGVLWPEKLKSLTQGFDSTTFDHYARFDVLLMDDPLITAGRESKLVDALKNLIDVRIREGRATIITSQIGSEEEIAEAKEFGDAKTADIERIKALRRRFIEDALVIGFAPVEPKIDPLPFG